MGKPVDNVYNLRENRGLYSHLPTLTAVFYVVTASAKNSA
ncbi:hypothetical protein ApDm4_1538 [Acetobacter pomorum]|nr:hypothetical protein ApDm4_1538 [Acetobacter pomorum]